MTQFSQRYALADLAALEVLLLAGDVGLYKTQIPLVDTNVTATFAAVECDYDGYARLPIPAGGQPYQSGAGLYSIETPTLQFDYGPAAVPPITNDVVGYFVLDNAGLLLYAVQFDVPKPMNNVLNAILIDLVVNKASLAA